MILKDTYEAVKQIEAWFQTGSKVGISIVNVDPGWILSEKVPAHALGSGIYSAGPFVEVMAPFPARSASVPSSNGTKARHSIGASGTELSTVAFQTSFGQ